MHVVERNVRPLEHRRVKDKELCVQFDTKCGFEDQMIELHLFEFEETVRPEG
jgi:hypothetical protein